MLAVDLGHGVDGVDLVGRNLDVGFLAVHCNLVGLVPDQLLFWVHLHHHVVHRVGDGIRERVVTCKVDDRTSRRDSI